MVVWLVLSRRRTRGGRPVKKIEKGVVVVKYGFTNLDLNVLVLQKYKHTTTNTPMHATLDE